MIKPELWSFFLSRWGSITNKVDDGLIRRSWKGIQRSVKDMTAKSLDQNMVILG